MTVGVIGTGHIGRVAAKLFKSFGAKVIGYDLYPNDVATKYLEYKDSVEEVVKEADVVTLHVPVFCKTFLHNIAAINYTILHLKDSFSYLCLDSAFFSRKLSPVKLNM